jgi:hypothetical protein
MDLHYSRPVKSITIELYDGRTVRLENPKIESLVITQSSHGKEKSIDVELKAVEILTEKKSRSLWSLPSTVAKRNHSNT